MEDTTFESVVTRYKRYWDVVDSGRRDVEEAMNNYIVSLIRNGNLNEPGEVVWYDGLISNNGYDISPSVAIILSQDSQFTSRNQNDFTFWTTIAIQRTSFIGKSYKNDWFNYGCRPEYKNVGIHSIHNRMGEINKISKLSTDFHADETVISLLKEAKSIYDRRVAHNRIFSRIVEPPVHNVGVS